ncbi:type II toxin-antitoxin system RelE/ParE family toxin [Reichenbachiella versicolor]|uniref:type II toxin-antitoxin system RelE/ParE family toxin n=1 Tax=Reichenbachiella versicolor TaxID=1821036 RepID=UPI000D6E348E|nr:type II toxin-antitoxin system RelE/ParE family toxin [Reichenbachiella versicolor]
MDKFKIVWADQAKLALKDIYNYYKEKSLQVAKNIKSDLLQSPKTIHFSKQYQLDEINPKYRRIVVRHYKVLYKQKGDTISVVDIVSTRQSPEVLESK